MNGSWGRFIRLAAAAVLLLGVGAAAGAEAPRADLIWVPAQVADASDRAYEPVAIHLIDHATSSIVLGMYYLKEGEDDRHPVSLLLNDLREVAQRGVRVEVYLNTKFAGEAAAILDTPWVTRLRAAGAIVTGLTPSRRHGKLPFGGTKASGSFKPAGVFSAAYCTTPVAFLEDRRPLNRRPLLV